MSKVKQRLENIVKTYLHDIKKDNPRDKNNSGKPRPSQRDSNR